MPVRSERVISPVPRKQYVYPGSYRGYGNRPAPTGVGASPALLSGVLRVLLGIGGGFGDYDRRRRIIANAPKPTARSERADGSGTELTVELMVSEAVVAADNPDNFKAPA